MRTLDPDTEAQFNVRIAAFALMIAFVTFTVLSALGSMTASLAVGSATFLMLVVAGRVGRKRLR